MKQEEYRSCVGKNLKGKTGLSPEERKLEFCIVSRLCSKKVASREEAKISCKESANKPKPLKQPSTKRGSKSCEKQSVQLLDCVIENIPQDSLCNINKLQMALGNALILCSCHPEEKGNTKKSEVE